MPAKTLFEKIWESHVVREEPGEPALLYVDLHLIHEVTSAQAFEGLRLAGRRVRRPELSLATMDHNVPTVDGPVTDPLARAQLDTLRQNCAEFGVPLYATGSGREGIVHAGPVIEGLSMEGRMTVCNMSIEAGARAGMIAPDETTFAYLEGRPGAPAGAAWERALDDWRSLATDADAAFDRELVVDVTRLVPQVTWGTNPQMVAPVHGEVPDPADYDDPAERAGVERALAYMGLAPGTKIEDIAVDRVFIGSRPNAP